MNIAIICIREIKNLIVNHYLLAMTILLAILAFAIVFLGSTPIGGTKIDKLILDVSSLSSLSIFLLPLIALFISYDSIVGEYEKGNLLLILSYPISKEELLLGKFIAHWITISIAIIIGYSIALSSLLFTNEIINFDSIMAYLRLLFSSVLLAGVFIALGYLVSVSVNLRTSSVALCIGIWLTFVILFDMFVLGLLVSNITDVLTAEVLNKILLLNPVDIFRLCSIGEQSNNLVPLQTFSQYNMLSTNTLLLILILWLVTPLIISVYIFKRKKI